MTELTQGLFQVSKSFITNNKGSLLRTLVYTIGHFLIAIVCLMLIADVSFLIALTDAIVEPIANSIWYFLLSISLCGWLIVYSCQNNKKSAIFVLLTSILLSLFCYTISKNLSKLLLLPLIVWLNFALLLNVFEVSNTH